MIAVEVQIPGLYLCRLHNDWLPTEKISQHDDQQAHLACATLSTSRKRFSNGIRVSWADAMPNIGGLADRHGTSRKLTKMLVSQRETNGLLQDFISFPFDRCVNSKFQTTYCGWTIIRQIKVCTHQRGGGRSPSRTSVCSFLTTEQGDFSLLKPVILQLEDGGITDMYWSLAIKMTLWISQDDLISMDRESSCQLTLSKIFWLTESLRNYT